MHAQVTIPNKPLKVMNQLIRYNNHNSSMMLRKPVEYITIEEADLISGACDIIYERSSHTKNDLWLRDRDKFLLTLMWVSGARITDILYLSDNNINFGNKTITFLVKKRKDKDRPD
jgi:integrase